MPGLHRAVEVKLPEADVLADLYGIEYDLSTASFLCAKALELSNLEQRDYLHVEALVSAAIIRYGRCFSTGARLGLTRKDIDGLDSAALEVHDYFKALRDKFVAHSVNPYENSYVTASVSERDGVRFPIESLNPGYHRLVLSGNEAQGLSLLVNKVKAIVNERIERERTKLLAFIKTLPLDVIHSGDLHSPQRFKMTDADKSRKQSRALTTRSKATRKSSVRPQRKR